MITEVRRFTIDALKLDLGLVTRGFLLVKCSLEQWTVLRLKGTAESVVESIFLALW